MPKSVPLVFLDTNVVVDLLSGREPYAYHAADVFQLALDGQCKLCLSALTMMNAHFLLKSVAGEQTVRHQLQKLEDLVKVLSLHAADIAEALRTDWKDFEDATQYLTAHRAGAQYIVTRNAKDFRKSTIPVLSPQLFVEKHIK